MTINAGVDRRTGKDRRQGNRPLRKRLFFKGMRQSVRRKADRRRIVALDRYKQSLFIAVMVVLTLSLLDALLTLILINEGARELNPIMAYCLRRGPRVFLLVKYGLTGLSVLFIVLTHHANMDRSRFFAGLLPGFATLLGCVVLWEIYLLAIL
jgi:hypothetical protein